MVNTLNQNINYVNKKGSKFKFQIYLTKNDVRYLYNKILIC